MKTITQTKNKKGASFSLTSWIISLMLFGGLVGIMAIMAASNATDYGNSQILDNSLGQRYNTLNNSTSAVQSALAAVTDKGGLTVIGTFNILFASVFTVFNLVFGTLTLPAVVLANFVSDFGVPKDITSILIPMWLGIITITIIFVILSTNTRRDL